MTHEGMRYRPPLASEELGDAINSLDVSHSGLAFRGLRVRTDVMSISQPERCSGCVLMWFHLWGQRIAVWRKPQVFELADNALTRAFDGAGGI